MSGAWRQASAHGQWCVWALDSASEVESQTQPNGLQEPVTPQSNEDKGKAMRRGDTGVRALPTGIHAHIIKNIALAKQNRGAGWHRFTFEGVIHAVQPSSVPGLVQLGRSH